MLHVTTHVPALQPTVPFVGTSHFFVHEPQLSAFDKSVSQPSFGSVLQLSNPVAQLPSAH